VRLRTGDEQIYDFWNIMAMKQNRVQQAFSKNSDFSVVVELTAGPNYDLSPIEHFLEQYKAQGRGVLPGGFDFVGIMSPQTPGGTPNVDPSMVLAYLQQNNLLSDLAFVPHVACKDQNTDALVSSIMAFKNSGVDSILALTGDKPIKGKGVFELEAVGLVDAIAKINADSCLKSKPEGLADVHQFFVGAAVSPFKYSEPSQMQQYYKMEKKIAAGTDYLITQVGWDWKKSLELFRYLDQVGLDIPVIGNVFLLTTTNQAPRLMHDGKLQGCFVSDGLYEKLCSESLDQHIERAAQQVAMYKSMGASGVDIGSVHDYDVLVKILCRAAQIGDSWVDYKDNLYWPADEPFYLYGDNGQPNPLTKCRKTISQLNFNIVHNAVLDDKYPGFHAFKNTMKFLGAKKGKGVTYKCFNAIEKASKYMLFECENCGDCYLPENFGLCTIGGCEKGLANVPCGDATVDGKCGNNLDRSCIGEKIYKAAAASKDGLEKLRTTSCQPRDHQLEDQSSIINYLFARDHTRANPLTIIADDINAVVPKISKIMKTLHSLGDDAAGSPELNYIKTMIESQARANPDYIAINIDAIGENVIADYTQMISKWGKGASVCIDSANVETLQAGLTAWQASGENPKPPMLSLNAQHGLDKLLAMKAKNDFVLCVTLQLPENGSMPESTYLEAKSIVEKATSRFGFKADQIYFDIPATPLAKDIGEDSSRRSKTNLAFETMRKIKADPKLKGVHCSMRPAFSAIAAPRRIGICRAFIENAMHSGLDTAMITPTSQYGLVPAAADLIDLVERIANVDGDADNHLSASKAAGRFFKKK
jgi:methylenetetrahydrofolate reductase (NADPH)